MTLTGCAVVVQLLALALDQWQITHMALCMVSLALVCSDREEINRRVFPPSLAERIDGLQHRP